MVRLLTLFVFAILINPPVFSEEDTAPLTSVPEGLEIFIDPAVIGNLPINCNCKKEGNWFHWKSDGCYLMGCVKSDSCRPTPRTVTVYRGVTATANFQGVEPYTQEITIVEDKILASVAVDSSFCGNSIDANRE